MNSLFNIIRLAILLLLYTCLLKYVEGGGKGKVPVYMPIPIPIPMPIRGEGGGPKFHHNHNQNEGQGEVKKIYLLHPMPKQHSSPNFNNHHEAHQNTQNSYQAQQQQQHHSNKGHTDMKILPIVVIPPIAPMPPIHLPPQDNSHSSSPRMTLSPQFNNYLLSNSDSRGHLRGGRGGYSQQHHNMLYQDHKNFADYGGSGGGAMFRRERMARSRSRHPGGGGRASFDYMPRARVRIQDDFGVSSMGLDDYDFGSSSWRPRSSSMRQQQQQLNSRRMRSRANSIRDVMEMQPTDFDDEPTSLLPLEVPENREQPSRATSGSGRSLVVNGRNINLENLDDKADRDSGDRDYLDSQSIVSPSSSRNADRSYGSGGQKGPAENTLYYDRDYQHLPDEPAGRLSIKYTSNGAPQTSKRLYLDDREIMDDDDQWRFDSIKTVTHANPSGNMTIINGNNSKPPTNSNVQSKQNNLTTTTTTIIPPRNILN